MPLDRGGAMKRWMLSIVLWLGCSSLVGQSIPISATPAPAKLATTRDEGTVSLVFAAQPASCWNAVKSFLSSFSLDARFSTRCSRTMSRVSSLCCALVIDPLASSMSSNFASTFPADACAADSSSVAPPKNQP